MTPNTIYAAASAPISRNMDAPGTSSSMNTASAAINMGSKYTPHNTPSHAVFASTVKTAFSKASEGRRQAAMAASYMATSIYRAPHEAAGLRKACLEWLAGTDLTLAATCAKSGGQAVIKRLNECLDGDSRRVTATLLKPEDIAHLRVFRQSVRELIKGQ